MRMQEILQTAFPRSCQQFGREDVAEAVQHRLAQPDDTGCCVSEGLLRRVLGRKASDVREYVDQHLLPMPAGLKLKLVNQLVELQCYVRIAPPRASAVLDGLLLSGPLAAAAGRWRAGQLSCMALMDTLSQCSAANGMDAAACSALTAAVLQDAGHRHSSRRPVYAESAACRLDHILAMHPMGADGSCLRLQCLHGVQVAVPADITDAARWVISTPDPHPSAHTPSTHTQGMPSCSLRWRHCPEGRGLRLSAGGAASACVEVGGLLEVTMMSSHRDNSKGRGTVEVDRVLCADAQGMQLAVVVHGRWLSPLPHHTHHHDHHHDDHNNPDNTLNIPNAIIPDDDNYHLMSDGLTDVCRCDELAAAANGSPNADSAQQEVDQRFMPAFDHPLQHFLVMATMDEDEVRVQQVMPLRDLLEPDQMPACVAFHLLGSAAAEERLLLFGSHGLLAAVTKAKGCGKEVWQLTALTSDDHRTHTPSTPGYGHIPHDDPHYHPTHTPKGHGHAHGHSTHSPCSNIIAASCAGERMVSVDDEGLLVLWDLMTMTTACAPYALREEGRACTVQLAPSGEHVAVGLWDRLLLLCRTSEEVFYERGVLDVLPGVRAKYAVSFLGSSMRIWRATNSNTTGITGIVLSCWSHANIDAFDLRHQQHQLQLQLSTEMDHHPAGGAKQMPSVPVSVPAIPVVRMSLKAMVARLQAPPRPPPHPKPMLSLSPSSSYDEDDWLCFLRVMRRVFVHDRSVLFLKAKALLAVLAATFQPPSLAMLSAALDASSEAVEHMIRSELCELVAIAEVTVRFTASFHRIAHWMTSDCCWRIGGEYSVDVSAGHNLMCALYLKLSGNKSVAVEHAWQGYLQTYGPMHLRRASRGLRQLTAQIRKIDETANIRGSLPHQIGYIAGLQEIYARRVGLGGRIPRQLGELQQLRVLSMGNNHLSGPLPCSLGALRHLQRIVLHQNNLCGAVPAALGDLGCIVNLAGNPHLEYGEDVPRAEREALVDLFRATNGERWSARGNWSTAAPVCTWYKVSKLSPPI